MEGPTRCIRLKSALDWQRFHGTADLLHGTADLLHWTAVLHRTADLHGAADLLHRTAALHHAADLHRIRGHYNGARLANVSGYVGNVPCVSGIIIPFSFRHACIRVLAPDGVSLAVPIRAI